MITKRIDEPPAPRAPDRPAHDDPLFSSRGRHPRLARADVAAQMRLQGADVVVTDPAALENARRAWPDLHYEDKTEVACAGADVVLLLTEWQQYRRLDPAVLAGIVRSRNVLDGRNALDPQRWRAAG